MLKKVVVLTVAATMFVLTGCDAGSNSFSKCGQPHSVAKLAQLTPEIVKEKQ